MNKYQKAIEVIRSNYPPEHYSMLREALDLSINLLDKATPKKPVLEAMPGFTVDEASYPACPICKRQINVWSARGYDSRYCHYCGQALDWGKEEEND